MFAAHNMMLTPLAGAAPLSFINATNADADNVTLPTHQAGDLFILHLVRDFSSTPPSLPTAGGTIPAWTDVPNCNNTGTVALATRTIQFVATANNHTSGTFANCSSIIAAVVRGQHSTPIGGSLQTGSSVSSPTTPAITLTNTDGSSLILSFMAVRATATWGSVPAGYTQRAANTRAVLLTKNVTTSDGSVSMAVTGNTGSQSSGATIEIRSH